MDLSIDHVFAIAPLDYARLYFDEEFSAAICAHVRLGRTVLRLDRTPERIVRHVRCEPVRDIPAPLAKLLRRGPSRASRGLAADGAHARFHYVEEIDFDLVALRGRWRVVPSVFSSKVDASGTLAFEPVDHDPGAVRRAVRGQVAISVLGVGGLAEKWVVGEVQRSYADASVFTRRYLDQR
jgi:hypothetical protein